MRPAGRAARPPLRRGRRAAVAADAAAATARDGAAAESGEPRPTRRAGTRIAETRIAETRITGTGPEGQGRKIRVLRPLPLSLEPCSGSRTARAEWRPALMGREGVRVTRSTGDSEYTPDRAPAPGPVPVS